MSMSMSRLTPIHRQRLALAVEAARRGAEVVFNEERTESGARQFVWYRNAAQQSRSVILVADGAEFRELVTEARAAFVAMLLSALPTPIGAVLERGESADAMEEARR